MREACRGRGLAAAAFWKSFQNQEPRVFDDVALGDEQARAYSLVLIGGPGENAVTRRLAARLPVAAVGGRDPNRPAGVSSDQTPASSSSTRARSTRPATSRWSPGPPPEGLSRWDSGETAQNRWDYVVFDAKSSSEGMLPERLRIASGFFDAAWQFSERFVREGDAGERAKAPARPSR